MNRLDTQPVASPQMIGSNVLDQDTSFSIWTSEERTYNVDMRIAKEDSSFPLMCSDCISVTLHHTGPGEAVMDTEVVYP